MPGIGRSACRIALEILLRALASAAVGQPEVDSGVIAPVLRPDGRHRQNDLGKAFQHFLDLAHLAVGEFEARAYRRVETQGNEAFVDLRRKLLADKRKEREAAEEDEHRGPQHDAAVTDRRPARLERSEAARSQRAPRPDHRHVHALLVLGDRPFQHPPVHAVHPLDDAFDTVHEAAQPRHAREARPGRIAPDRREHRIEGEAHEQGHQHGDGHCQAELEKELADEALHERDWHEHGDDRERRRHHGKTDFIGPFARRRDVALAHAEVAHDVLAHHDGVVDEKPDAQRQRHQRHHVEREAKCVQRDEGRDDRDRQREAGDDGAAPGMQEQENDQHREQRPLENRALDTVHAFLDLICLGIDDAHLDVRRQARLEGFERVANAAAGLDDVGVLGLADIEGDRRATVDAGDRIELLLAVDHVRDLAQVDGAATLLRDDNAAELRGVLDLAFDPHHRIVLPAGDPAGRYVLIGILHGGHHLIDADAERRQGGGLDLNENLPRHAPVDVDLRDAGDVLERLDDGLIGKRGQFAQLDRRRKDRERHGGSVVLDVHPEDLRVLDVTRESRPYQRNLVAGVLNRAGDVCAETELDENLALPFARVRIDPLNSRHRVDGVFDRLAHVRFDDFRRSSRIDGQDLDIGQRDVGHLLDAQPRVREQAEYHDPDHNHGREHRVVNRDSGDPHGPTLPVFAVSPRQGPSATLRREPVPGRPPSGCRKARPGPGCRVRVRS
jgi:hypothetical protein